MRKVLFAFVACIMAGIMTSCSNNTPRGVAEKAMECIIDEDYREYFDYVYFPEEKKQEKEAYISMIEGKVKKEKENGSGSRAKPVSYKFVSEEIDENSGRARVVLDVTYDSGKTQKEPVNLIKEKDGKWYIENKK